jgi:CheY-like chemotaxis protein
MEAKGARILLVDDDESFRYAAERALRQSGCDVVAAPDYRLALAMLEGGQRFDLLVTDILMPDRIHGFALARMARMRQLGLKVLYMTAYDVPTNEASGKILRKPISDEQLIDEVRIALADS